jgi:hypothetical protein
VGLASPAATRAKGDVLEALLENAGKPCDGLAKAEPGPSDEDCPKADGCPNVDPPAPMAEALPKVEPWPGVDG